MEIAVVGKSEFVAGFRLAGIHKTYDVKTDKDIESKIRECLNDRNLGIIVLHSDDLKNLSPALQKVIDESVEPTFIAIGSKEDAGLRDKIKRAIGVDLWK